MEILDEDVIVVVHRRNSFEFDVLVIAQVKTDVVKHIASFFVFFPLSGR